MQEHADDSAGSGLDMQSPGMVYFDTSTAGSEAHRGQDAEGDHSAASGGEETGPGSGAKRKKKNAPAVIEAQVTLSIYMGILAHSCQEPLRFVRYAMHILCLKFPAGTALCTGCREGYVGDK